VLVSSVRECNVCTAPADVAQLVEQRFRKPQVTGSNPVVGLSLFLLCRFLFSSNWWTRFVPVSALLVGVRDLQNARFIEGFA
jgi:hypothetical protein